MPSVTVADVLSLSPLREARPRLVAGVRGIGHPVRWVHTTELSDIAPLLREGDLLLSTGIAMPDSDAELCRYAESLAQSGAAGLVIELGRRWRHSLPSALVGACDDHSLPLVQLDREVRFAAVAQSVGERIVDTQVSELREAQQVHEEFTELSIAEAGADKVLDAVQRLAGTAVILENAEHRVLDYRRGRLVSTDFLHDWAHRSHGVALSERTAWDESQGWLITRVGRPERNWGRLIIESPQPPSARLVVIAERGAAALALHRLHDRQRDSAIRRTHYEIMLGLLTDPGSPELVARCELAGVPISNRQFVGLTIRPLIDAASPSSSINLIDEVIGSVVHATHEVRVAALVCEIEHDVRVFLSLPRSSRTDKVTEGLAARIKKRHTVIVAAGRPVARIGEADRTIREAQHVMRSLRDARCDPEVSVYRLDDVHLRGLLALLVDDDRVRLFTTRELEPLRRHDSDRGTELVRAVQALLQHPTSKSDAAASLHVSRPVFYDRIAKAGRLLNADLDDPETRVSLHVALLAHELAVVPATEG